MPRVPDSRAADAAVFLQQQLSDRPDRDAILIHAEMIHDARIIRLDGRGHAPSRIRSWLGDSIGHWEGDTLVVDTTNFNDGGGFYGDAGGNFGWDRDLHLVERFSFLDADTLLYKLKSTTRPRLPGRGRASSRWRDLRSRSTNTPATRGTTR